MTIMPTSGAVGGISCLASRSIYAAKASVPQDRTVKSSDFLQSVIDEVSNDTRVEIMRSIIFQLYTKCLASGRAPRRIRLDAELPSGGPAAIDLHPYIGKVETLGGLVKTLFSAKSTHTVEALPCRVEDAAGSGLGLMLMVKRVPVIAIGPLAAGDGLFLRQIDTTNRTIFQTKIAGEASGIAQATVAPLSTVFLRKPK